MTTPTPGNPNTRPGAWLVAVALAALPLGCGGTKDDPRVHCSGWEPRAIAAEPLGTATVIAVARNAFPGRDGKHLVYRSTDNRIFARRVATGEERELVVADDVSIFPGSVDGDRLVAYASSGPDNDQEYFSVDVEACRSTELDIRVSTSDVKLGYSVMAAIGISGDRLFYSISRGSLRPGEVYVLDLASLERRAVPADAHVVYAASLDGDRATWLQRGTDGGLAVGHWSVAGEAARTFPLPEAAAPSAVSASGARAVWSDHRDLTGVHNEHVLLLDLETGEERRVSEDGAREIDPSVLGRLVAWADARSGRFAIRVLDLDTGEEREVAAVRGRDLRWPTLTAAGLFWIAPSADGAAVYFDPEVRP